MPEPGAAASLGASNWLSGLGHKPLSKQNKAVQRLSWGRVYHSMSAKVGMLWPSVADLAWDLELLANESPKQNLLTRNQLREMFHKRALVNGIKSFNVNGASPPPTALPSLLCQSLVDVTEFPSLILSVLVRRITFIITWPQPFTST